MKKKVLFAIDSLALGGGAERLVFDIVEELQLRDTVEIFLVYFIDSNVYGYQNVKEWEQKINKNVKLIFCDYKLEFNILGKPLKINKKFNELLEQITPEVIHSHLPYSELITRLNILDDIKYFSHLHDNMKLFENKMWYQLRSRLDISNYFIRKWLMKHYIQCNNQFISISADTYAYYSTNLPSKLKNNIIRLPNAVNTNRFSAFRLKSISTNQKVKLVSVGSLVPKKNHLFLLDVVSILLNKGIDVELSILGGGDELNKMETKIKSLGIEKQVRLLGYTDKVEEELEKATFYVHSATYEPFGLAIVEGLAAGLPVICLDGRGNREFIENDRNGFLFYDINPEKFADKIIEYINNPNQYQKMSAYAKEVAKRYDIKNYVDRLIEIYNS